LAKPVVVETKDLTKNYNGTTVVDKLNLRIEEGDIFGFLGPNGAGKTTTILMMLGLTEPTSGTVRIGGFNSTREPLKIKRITGYIPEKVGFYEDLTAGYNLAYTARLNGLPENKVEKRVAEALETVELTDVADKLVSEFSRGMKQRLAIADMLIKMPKVAILDEPTSGIDPEGIVHMLDLIARVAKEKNMTVIMSSHQLNQVQRICNRVGILAEGRLVAEGLLDQMGRKAMGGGEYKIEIKLAEITAPLIDCIKQVKGVTTVERIEGTLLVSSKKDLRAEIAKAIVDANGLLEEMKVQSYALEDIYMKYFKEG